MYIGYILIEKKMIHAPLCTIVPKLYYLLVSITRFFKKNWCSQPCSEIETIIYHKKGFKVPFFSVRLLYV